MKNQLIFLITLFFGLSSCIDEYQIPISQETEQLVVEGTLTDEDQLPSVRLSVTTQFGNATTYKPVQGAFVSITDNTNKSVKLAASSSSPGVYVSEDVSFRGQAGKAYKLLIKLTDGRTFETTPQAMPAPVPVSNLYARFDAKTGYQVFADLNDPRNTENYYRWTAYGFSKRKTTGVPTGFGGGVCCDVCWVRTDNSSANVFTDRGVDGNILRGRAVYNSPIYYFGNHYVEVKQFNTSRAAFQFWQRYQQQSQRTGTIFDPLPAPVTGNVINQANANDLALGFFEVASVTTKRLIVPGDTLIGKIIIPTDLIGQGDCLTRFPYSSYANMPPPGW